MGAHVRSERLAWSREQVYQLGRTPAPRLAALGLGQVAGTAETAVYSGRLDDQLIDRFLAQCAIRAGGRRPSPSQPSTPANPAAEWRERAAIGGALIGGMGLNVSMENASAERPAEDLHATQAFAQ
jgi:hypothetical protein